MNTLRQIYRCCRYFLIMARMYLRRNGKIWVYYMLRRGGMMNGLCGLCWQQGAKSFHQGCQGTYSSILGSSNITSQDGKDAAIGGGRGYSKTTEGKGVEVTARSTTIRRWATSESSQPGKRGQDTACLRLACPAIKRHQQRVRRVLGTQIGISLLDCPVI